MLLIITDVIIVLVQCKVMSEQELFEYTVFLNDIPYTLWLHAFPELDVHNNDHYYPQKDAANSTTTVSKTKSTIQYNKTFFSA